MSSMFRHSRVKELDLSSFVISSVKNFNEMFKGSLVSTGYARTRTEADKFNYLLRKPVFI